MTSQFRGGKTDKLRLISQASAVFDEKLCLTDSEQVVNGGCAGNNGHNQDSLSSRP